MESGQRGQACSDGSGVCGLTVNSSLINEGAMGPKKQAATPAPVLSRQLIAPKNKDKIPVQPSEDHSKALVPFTGKRHGPGVSSRELILYAKEHGGELVLARNITGPEKLRLKAGEFGRGVCLLSQRRPETRSCRRPVQCRPSPIQPRRTHPNRRVTT